MALNYQHDFAQSVQSNRKCWTIFCDFQQNAKSLQIFDTSELCSSIKIYSCSKIFDAID